MMQLEITHKGRLAIIECAKCGNTITWHEWACWGQAQDLLTCQCPDCGGKTNPETYWESPSRNWYAGRYSMPGYLDCTDWEYGKNKQKLTKKLRELCG